jgi:hypothetical protein
MQDSKNAILSLTERFAGIIMPLPGVGWFDNESLSLNVVWFANTAECVSHKKCDKQSDDDVREQ